MLIDTHSHIFDTQFDEDRSLTIARAVEVGVEHILLPAIDSQTYSSMMQMVADYPDICHPMIGLHPTSVNDNENFRDELTFVENMLDKSSNGVQFCAIGEVGLDFYWSKDFEKEQFEAFEKQIDLALKYNLPLAIHTRDAWDQMCELLNRYRGEGLRGVMHSFSGTLKHFASINSLDGFYFGIGGPLTYKNSPLVEIVCRMPLDKIVLETDSPYLPPVPYRGKRNESSFLPLVCRKIAAIKNITEQEVASHTSMNAKQLFNL